VVHGKFERLVFDPISSEKSNGPIVVCHVNNTDKSCQIFGSYTPDPHETTSSKLVLSWRSLEKHDLVPASLIFNFSEHSPYSLTSVKFGYFYRGASGVATLTNALETYTVSRFNQSLTCGELTFSGRATIINASDSNVVLTFYNIRLQGNMPTENKGAFGQAEQCKNIPAPEKKKEGGNNTVAIAIISIAALVLIGGGIACLIRYRMRRMRIREYSIINSNEVDE